MKSNQTAVKILSLLILLCLMIPMITVASASDEADASLPDVFDEVIDTSKDEITPEEEEEEPLPAGTVAIISIAVIGLFLALIFWIRSLSAKKKYPKKKSAKKKK